MQEQEEPLTCNVTLWAFT